MKTTIDIPESLYPELAAASSARGISVEDFILQTTQRELQQGKASNGDTSAQPLTIAERFRGVFGSADPEAVAEVQQIIDQEFSQIDPRDWE